ncbi:MAG: hypothetical protein ACFB2W_21965 [Leptolyngbyaceae cyanobacterium]
MTAISRTVIPLSVCNTSRPYDRFIAALKARKIWDAGTLIQQMLGDFDSMSLTEKYAQVDKLKGWLDSFRPLSPAVVAELKQLFDVRFTYNSNAIEGNTLTQSETQLVLEKGITAGSKGNAPKKAPVIQ